MTMTYENEPWFALLQTACQSQQRKKVAEILGISPPLLSQVLNGSGKYGSGEASTAKLADRVMHTYGRYDCPHLTEQNGVPHVITSEECRVFAHRPAPIGSPRDMQHWQSCNACPHKAHTAPPVVREGKPRKPRNTEAELPTATPAATPSLNHESRPMEAPDEAL